MKKLFLIVVLSFFVYEVVNIKKIEAFNYSGGSFGGGGAGGSW
jgi:hypothetical protein